MKLGAIGRGFQDGINVMEMFQDKIRNIQDAYGEHFEHEIKIEREKGKTDSVILTINIPESRSLSMGLPEKTIGYPKRIALKFFPFLDDILPK